MHSEKLHPPQACAGSTDAHDFMKRLSMVHLATLLLVAVLLPISAFAREGTPPRSQQIGAKALSAIEQFAVTPTDVAKELTVDGPAGRETPLRYAVPYEVSINPLTHGTWEDLPDGRLWRLRVVSEGSTDLNFGFSTCYLPAGTTLHISSESENYFQGPYSVRDNKEHGQLWTPVIPGSRAVIELFVSNQAKEQPRLTLARVNRGYRDLFHRKKELGLAKAGTCNNDVVCALGDPWRNEIRSVARYSRNGSYLCTGTLVNNVANNFKNFFLTATHCGLSVGNAATVVVYWNYEATTCGQHSGGSLNQNQSGATLRMSRTDVDVALIELDDIPDSNFHVYYAGWDRSGTVPTGVVGIHHPNADEKSISFSTTAPTSTENCIDNNPVGLTHWQVVWNSGVTEPGSSGSGIWDVNTHRLIGTLSGGDSSCENSQGPDCYGKFGMAWTGGGGASARLRDWLDAGNSGATNVAGRDPNPMPLIIADSTALISESCLPTNGVIDSGEFVTVSFTLQNFGASNSVNLVATLLATNGITSPSAPQNYGVVVAGGAAVTRNFTFVASGACGSVISPKLQLQDGIKNLGVLTFNYRLGTPIVTFAERFDAVTAAVLPAGWTSDTSGSDDWITTNLISHTSSNSAFASDPPTISDSALTSPSISIVNPTAQVLFNHYVNTEDGFDGGVLEISITNGPWDDIITAGGAFLRGGYNTVIPTNYQSAIATRSAWTGNSGGFIETVATLPATAASKNIRLRWRLATDESEGAPGWYVDTISIQDGYNCCESLGVPQIIDTRRTNNTLVFSFNTSPGATYVTEFKSLLNTNVAWTPLQTNIGDGTKKSVTNSVNAAANRFFRVKAQP
jgi:hypothetical protein